MRKCVITNAIIMNHIFQNPGNSAERRTSSDSLTNLQSRFIQVKRDFREIKMTTEKQLDDIKREHFLSGFPFCTFPHYIICSR